MIGCPESSAWARASPACDSQQPTWPQVAHSRRLYVLPHSWHESAWGAAVVAGTCAQAFGLEVVARRRRRSMPAACGCTGGVAVALVTILRSVTITRGFVRVSRPYRRRRCPPVAPRRG